MGPAIRYVFGVSWIFSFSEINPAEPEAGVTNCAIKVVLLTNCSDKAALLTNCSVKAVLLTNYSLRLLC